MIRHWIPIGVTVAIVMSSLSAQAQTRQQYIVLADSADQNAKMLEGIITKSDLASDATFGWYAESRSIYQHPDTVAVNALKNNKDKIYFLFFGGTWCEDTQFILAKFYQIQEASGFPDNRITIFALDRKKNGTGNIAHALNISRTPTVPAAMP